MFVTSMCHVISAHFKEWVSEDMSLFELQQVSAAYLFSSLPCKQQKKILLNYFGDKVKTR